MDVSTGTQLFVTRQTGKGHSQLNFIAWASDKDSQNQVERGETTKLKVGSPASSWVPKEESTATVEVAVAAAVSPADLPPPLCPRDPPILAGLYCGKECGELDVWDMVRGSRRETLSYNENPISCVDVAAGVGIAAGCDNGAAIFWLLNQDDAL